jgi:hypothetical protein
MKKENEMTKKLILALLMSASYMGSIQTASIQDINLGDLQTQLTNEVTKLEPIIETIVTKLSSGDAAGLKSYINGLGSFDLTPAVTFLQNNLGTIQGSLLDALNNIPYSQLPTAYQSTVKSAADQVASNINIFSSIQGLLTKLKPYANITNYKTDIVNGLESALASPEFAAIKPDIIALYNNQLKPAFNTVTNINLSTLKDAIASGIKKANGNELTMTDLSNLAKGFSTIRKLAPAIPGLINGLSSLVLKINSVLSSSDSISAPVQQALTSIQSFANELSGDLQTVNTQINNAVASLQQ